MDWQAMIERHRGALKRIVSVLVAMVGAGPEAAADRPTLARHRHRALLRLVRPAEAAARRLVIVLALACCEQPEAGINPPVVAMRPGRKRRHFLPIQPKTSSAIVKNGIGTGIVLPACWSASPASPETPPRALRLPLTDPVRRLSVRRVAVRNLPRISVESFRPPQRALPAPDDRLDATRLVLRVGALAAALDDLPGEARRFERWRVRRAAERSQDRAFDTTGTPVRTSDAEAARQAKARAARRFRRVSPLRSGSPPGWRRRRIHEVHAILSEVHSLAFDALARLDTS